MELSCGKTIFGKLPTGCSDGNPPIKHRHVKNLREGKLFDYLSSEMMNLTKKGHCISNVLIHEDPKPVEKPKTPNFYSKNPALPIHHYFPRTVESLAPPEPPTVEGVDDWKDVRIPPSYFTGPDGVELSNLLSRIQLKRAHARVNARQQMDAVGSSVKKKLKQKVQQVTDSLGLNGAKYSEDESSPGDEFNVIRGVGLEQLSAIARKLPGDRTRLERMMLADAAEPTLETDSSSMVEAKESRTKSSRQDTKTKFKHKEHDAAVHNGLSSEDCPFLYEVDSELSDESSDGNNRDADISVQVANLKRFLNLPASNNYTPKKLRSLVIKRLKSKYSKLTVANVKKSKANMKEMRSQYSIMRRIAPDVVTNVDTVMKDMHKTNEVMAKCAEKFSKVADNINSGVETVQDTLAGMLTRMKELWENPALKTFVIGVLGAYLLHKYVKMVNRGAFSALYKKAIEFFSFATSYIPSLGKVTEYLARCKNRLVRSFTKSTKQCVDDPTFNSATAQIACPQTLSAFTAVLAGATLLATGLIVDSKKIYGTVTHVSKFLSSVETVRKTTGGWIKSMMKYLPVAVQLTVLKAIDVGDCRPKVKNAHTLAMMYVLRLKLDPNILTMQCHVQSIHGLIKSIKAMLGSCSPLEQALLVRAFEALKAIYKEESSIADKAGLKSVFCLLMGPVGLGKTVIVNKATAQSDLRRAMACWSRNQATEFDDGYCGQPAVSLDDYMCIDDPQGNIGIINSILEWTNESVSLINAAGLDGAYAKGGAFDLDFVFITTNASFREMKEQFKHSEAFVRRIMNKGSVCLDFVPTKRVKKNGRYVPALVRQLTTQELNDFVHVDIFLVREDERGLSTRKQLHSYKEIMIELLEARSVCDKSAGALDYHTYCDWMQPGGVSYTACEMLKILKHKPKFKKRVAQMTLPVIGDRITDAEGHEMKKIKVPFSAPDRSESMLYNTCLSHVFQYFNAVDVVAQFAGKRTNRKEKTRLRAAQDILDYSAYIEQAEADDTYDAYLIDKLNKTDRKEHTSNRRRPKGVKPINVQVLRALHQVLSQAAELRPRVLANRQEMKEEASQKSVQDDENEQFDFDYRSSLTQLFEEDIDPVVDEKEDTESVLEKRFDELVKLKHLPKNWSWITSSDWDQYEFAVEGKKGTHGKLTGFKSNVSSRMQNFLELPVHVLQSVAPTLYDWNWKKFKYLMGAVAVGAFIYGMIHKDEVTAFGSNTWNSIGKYFSNSLDFARGKDDAETVIVRIPNELLPEVTSAVNARAQSVTNKSLRSSRSNGTSHPTPLNSIPVFVNANQNMDVDEEGKYDLGMNKNAYHILHKIARNIVTVSTSSGKAHALGVGPNTLLIPTHMLTQINPKVHTKPSSFKRCSGPTKVKFESKDKMIPSVIIPQQNVILTSTNTPKQNPRTVHFVVDPMNELSLVNHTEESATNIPGVDSKQTPLPEYSLLDIPANMLAPFSTCKHFIMSENDWDQVNHAQVWIVKPNRTLFHCGRATVAFNSHWTGAARDKNGNITYRAYYTTTSAVIYYGSPGHVANKAGWCGLPVVAFIKGRIVIVGAHIAAGGPIGSPSDIDEPWQGMAIMLSRKMFTPAPIVDERPATFVNTKNQICRLTRAIRAPHLYQSRSPCETVGISDFEISPAVSPAVFVTEAHYPSRKRRCYRGPCTKSKAMSSYIANSGKVYVPAELDIDLPKRLATIHKLKPPVEFDWPLLYHCYGDSLQRCARTVPTEYKCLPFEAAIAGRNHPDCDYKHLSPLDLTTSAGVLRNKTSVGKKGCVVMKQDDVTNIPYAEPDEKMMNDMESMWQGCLNGDMPNFPFGPNVKDEGVNLKKAMEGRFRIFEMCTVAHTVLIRAKFATALNNFLSRGPNSDSALGMNPESRQWDRMIRQLKKVGSKNGFIDGDVVGMDASHRMRCIICMGLAVCRYIKPKGDIRPLFTLWMSMFIRDELYKHNLYTVCGPLGSGIPFTGFVNWLAIGGQGLKYSFMRFCQYCGRIASFALYHKWIMNQGTGDDFLASIARDAIPKEPMELTPELLLRYLAEDEKGQPIFTVTNSSKTGPPEWCPLYKVGDAGVGFLSGQVVPGILPGCIGAYNHRYFSESRIIKALTIFREGVLSEGDLTVTKFNSLLLLIMGSGPRRFHFFRNMFTEHLRECEIEDILWDWSDVTAIWDKPEDPTFVSTIAQMDSGGITISETLPSDENVVAEVVAPAHAEKALASTPWDMSTMAQRPQYIGTFPVTAGQEEGTTIVQLNLPHDAIVGTQVIPFANLRLFRGEIEIEIRMQGNPFTVGLLVANVMDAVEPNSAALLSDSKTTQSFRDPKFLDTTISNVQKIRVAYTCWTARWAIEQVTYASLIVRIWNSLTLPDNTAPGDGVVSISLFSSFHNASFDLINPVPDAAQELLRSYRNRFLRRYGLTEDYRLSYRQSTPPIKAPHTTRSVGWHNVKQQMMSEVVSKVSNVAKVVAKTVDEVIPLAGRDNPTVSLNPDQFVLMHPYNPNTSQVRRAVTMSTEPATTKPAATPADFGVDIKQSFDVLCRPCWFDTVVISPDTAWQAKDIIATGVITPGPNLGKGRLNTIVQPLSCEYHLCKFRTLSATFLLKLRFVLALPVGLRVAAAFLPGVYEVPEDISQIQKTFTHYFQVTGEETEFTLRCPWYYKNPRLYTINGQLSPANSIGIWIVWLVQTPSIPSAAPKKIYVNMFWGLENITADQWGLVNDTIDVLPLTAELPNEIVDCKMEKYQQSIWHRVTQQMFSADRPTNASTGKIVEVGTVAKPPGLPITTPINNWEELGGRSFPVVRKEIPANSSLFSSWDPAWHLGAERHPDMPEYFRTTPLSMLGQPFSAFIGDFQYYIASDSSEMIVLLNSSPRLSLADFKALVGDSTTSQQTTTSPVVYTNKAFSPHLMFKTTWIVQNRFVRIPKTQFDSGSSFEYCGVHLLVTNSSSAPTFVNIYVSLSDTFTFGYQNVIPRLQFRETNVGNDSWPPPIGEAQIGEYLLLVHDPDGVDFPWLDHREIFEQAINAKIQGEVKVPQRIKRPCAQATVRTNLFTATQLRELGLIDSPSDTITFQSNVITEVRTNLTVVVVIPVLTSIRWEPATTDIYIPDTVQRWTIEDPQGGVEDTSVTPAVSYTVGRSAVASPPWSDGFLRYLWGISVTAEVPVPISSRSEILRAPHTRFAVDAVEYGVVSMVSPGAIALKFNTTLN